MAMDTARLNEQHYKQAQLAALEATIAPVLLARKSAHDTLRIWLPDCADGQMAYAVAMIFYAYAQQQADPPTMQIFATDGDASAIATARRGWYHETWAALVPPKYLQTFFRYKQQFRVTSALREKIIFAQHNVLQDPPFLHLDLIVCSQLVSVFSPEDQQDQLIHAFHWCLRPGGYLMLAAECDNASLSQLFAHHSAAPGIMQRRDVPRMAVPPVPRPGATSRRQAADEPWQAVNERLRGINQALRRKVSELEQANDDLNNLIGAVNLPILFLDQRLQLARFTPQAARLFNLSLTDRGRPLGELHPALVQLVGDAANVLANLETVEREFQSMDGSWHLLRLRPYRTAAESIAGVVLIGVDITERRAAEGALRRAHDELEQRVRERTEELSTANVQLQVEIDERVRLEQERAEILLQLMTAQENERRRIARELHDQLGQTLTALGLGLGALANPALAPAQQQATVAHLRELHDQLGQEMNQLAVNLRPTALDDLGLIPATRHLVAQWAAQSGIDADFEALGLEHDRLPYDVESAIYRVVQESLTNILKHAAARHVSIILEQRDGYLRAIVEDDGCGFDLEGLQQAPNGRRRLGLLGMRERVALVGGTLTFQTAPGAGTTLFVQIPLAARAAGEPAGA